MTLDELRAFFRKNNYFSWLNVSGGEIFMRQDIGEIFRIMLAENPNLYLLNFSTTGFYSDLMVRTVREILDLNPKKVLITISIDGPEALHDEIRQLRGLWKKALRTFRRLKEMRSPALDVLLGVTISELNYRHIDELFESVKDEVPGVTLADYHLNLAHDSGHYYDNVGFVDRSGLGDLASIVDDFRKKRGIRLEPVSYLEFVYQKLLKRYVREGKCPLPCAALNSSCFIDPRWNLYPCATYDKKIANLRDYDFDLSKILSEKKTRELRKRIVRGICPQCWTPCEAYQTIFANLFRHLPRLMSGDSKDRG